MRVLVSHMRGEITRLININLIIVPSKVIDLATDENFTALSKDNFVYIFKGMKTMKKQNTFRIYHSGNTDSDTVESIFAYAAIIYDSEVLLKQWFGIDNAASDFNVKYWACSGSQYQ